jgi:hypothetical protein
MPVRDTDGDRAADVLFGCRDRVVLASLAVRGRVNDACAAGRTFEGPIAPTNLLVYQRWLAGGDLDGDGVGDIAVVDFEAGAVRVWLGANL